MFKGKDTILIVDDEVANTSLLERILRDDYNVKIANSAHEAILKAASEPFSDLILLDILMPDFDGFDLCRYLKAQPETKNIPVIFISGLGDIKNETEGFKIGAVDYITKPVSVPIVKARVRAHLSLYNQNKRLEMLVKKRTAELLMTRDVAITGFASLAETKDPETGAHIFRTQEYVRCLAENAFLRSIYPDEITSDFIEELYKSAPLHDIGKIGIPERILLKPGKLNEEEFEVMKTHTTIGEKALKTAERALSDKSSSFLKVAKEIALFHHEKWDGTGYPFGLSGLKIPIAGRIMAIADVYDALISKRIYKPAFSHEEALDIIANSENSHFDPQLVAIFMEINQDFLRIAHENTDEEMSVTC